MKYVFQPTHQRHNHNSIPARPDPRALTTISTPPAPTKQPPGGIPGRAAPRRGAPQKLISHARPTGALQITEPSRPERAESGCITVAPPIGPTVFVSAAKLTRDTLTLLSHLPPSIDAIAAIARSGLMPGSILAARLHLPLYSVTAETGVIELGAGYRMTSNGYQMTASNKARPAHVLVIDDTVGVGREMRICGPIVAQHFATAVITRAVIYCNPTFADAVDYAYAFYPERHHLEWCWANYGLGVAVMTDFDGVICEECPAESDDGGPRYRQFIQTARPLYLPRRDPLVTIVTARHEYYRQLTEAWLSRHRVVKANLIMRNWNYYEHLSHDEQVGAWKAETFRHSNLDYFIESSPVQAEIIHSLVGRRVICPAAERVW